MNDTIMIFDDSQENCIQIKEILGVKYDYIEVCDISQALKVLSDTPTISLVFIELSMKDDRGIDFYSKLQATGTGTLPPVVGLCDHCKSPSLSRALQLGLSSYFLRPLDKATLPTNVENVIRHRKKITADLEDSLNMLSSMFYLVMKVNLTTDTFTPISFLHPSESSAPVFSSNSFSGWLKYMVDSEEVYEDDWELYTDFTNIVELRNKFLEEKSSQSCKYHQRINGQYRWVQMELIKSCEYSDDNQVVVLYIRDVQEEYMQQKDDFLHMSTSASKTCIINITADKTEYIYGPLTSRSGKLDIPINAFITDAASRIPKKNVADKYRKMFCRENLIKNYQKGVKTLTLEHPYYGDEDSLYMIRTIVVMSEDSINKNIVGNFFAFDITMNYVNSVLPKKLFHSNYWNISIINTKNSEISFINLDDSDQTSFAPPIDYETSMGQVCDNYVIPSERKVFSKRTQVSYITSHMKKNSGSFEFTTNILGFNGEPRLLKSKYQYFKKELGFILNIIEDITDMSERDMLTGEFNRQGFVKQASKILQTPSDTEEYAIIYMDIKRFKAINELFGTETGDGILRMIPSIASRSFLKPILIARHTADRFVLLINRKNLNYDELTNFCTMKYDAGGKTIIIYLHCGIYLIEDKSMDVNSMCNRATIAERFIDNEHIRPYAIFESKMSESYIDRSALYNALPDALANQEFQPYYQPIFDSKTGEIVSAEALVRWFHPQWGFMNPGLFVPALEEGGYISTVDLMIATHVQQFLETREQANKPIVPVSINLSRMDFYDTEMMNVLQEKLSCTSLDRGFHRFEVTESSYMDITEDNVFILNRLRSLGAKILIDDFGSGYSSFGTIADYDFDIIKLDMAFVQKIGQNTKIESIIHSLIDMAHHLDAKVIAEGVETKEQFEFLRSNNCDYIQGYYFSKPLSEEAFVQLLDTTPIKSYHLSHKQ